jgi:hypothetical protein
VLIGVALAFLTLFLFVPLVSVFFEALKKGWEVYLAAITEADAVSAMWLTLIAAAISGAAEPGVRPVGGLGDRQVRLPRQAAVADLDRPAVLGEPGDRRSDLRAGVRPARLVRRMAAWNTT